MSDDWIVNGMASINVNDNAEPPATAEPKKRTVRQRTLYTSHSAPTPTPSPTSPDAAATVAAASDDADLNTGDPRHQQPRPITKKSASDDDQPTSRRPRQQPGVRASRSRHLTYNDTARQYRDTSPYRESSRYYEGALGQCRDTSPYPESGRYYLDPPPPPPMASSERSRHQYCGDAPKYDGENVMPTMPRFADDKRITGHLTAMATPHGTMSMTLRGRIRVDMTVDQAIRVINFENHIVMAMSASGGNVGLLHPNGRIWQYGSRVEIMAHDPEGNNKYAKMTYKGVGFTSDQCALVYLVDSAGTRTTTDVFSDMMFDYSLRLFYEESRHGATCVQEAMEMLKAAHYWQTDEGEDNWCVNGVRISQSRDGLVKIARNSNKYRMRTSPSNGTASITTPFLHCTASLGHTQHLFVRRGERRMHFDGSSFIVRNAGHSAGFDEKNQVKVY